MLFGAEAEEQIPAGGEEVGLYTSENDEAIQLTEDMYSSWYEGDQTYDGTEKDALWLFSYGQQQLLPAH